MITPCVLSKELNDLEANGIVTRTVYDTISVSVEYQLTPSGQSLHEVLKLIAELRQKHRAAVVGERWVRA